MSFEYLSNVVSEIGKPNSATGAIIFWLVIILTTVWTINWVIHKSPSHGNLWSFIRLVSMWVVVMFFFLYRDISRVHLIWVAPTTFIIGLLVSRLLKGASWGE